MPWRFAAWMIVSPGSALSSTPLRRNSVRSHVQRFFIRSVHLACQLLRKIFDHAGDRVGRRLPEPANRRVDHRPGKAPPAARCPISAARAARPPLRCRRGRACIDRRTHRQKAHQIQRGVACAVVLRKDDHRRGADEASVRLQRVEVERDVGQRSRQNSARGAARQISVELVSRKHAAAKFVDQLAHGDARPARDARPVSPPARRPKTSAGPCGRCVP